MPARAKEGTHGDRHLCRALSVRWPALPGERAGHVHRLLPLRQLPTGMRRAVRRLADGPARDLPGCPGPPRRVPLFGARAPRLLPHLRHPPQLPPCPAPGGDRSHPRRARRPRGAGADLSHLDRAQAALGPARRRAAPISALSPRRLRARGGRAGSCRIRRTPRRPAMAAPRYPRFDTLSLHAGQRPDPATGARATPIYFTTSFVFRDADHAAALFDMERAGHVYARISNPTNAVLEERVAALEGGVGAIATASGQAALHLAIATIAGAGTHIVASRALYGGSHNLLCYTLPRFGIETTFVDPRDLDAWRDAIRPS